LAGGRNIRPDAALEPVIDHIGRTRLKPFGGFLMLYHYIMFTVLCASVCLSFGAFMLVRHPQLVEKYAKWFGSLNWSGHTTFAVVFGLLAVLEIVDRFWFGAVTFGAVSGLYAYFAWHTKTNPPVKAGA
jgi:hypothetical protein